MKDRARLSEEEAKREILRAREAIDRVDEVLVKLLNQRIKYAVEIGELKSLLQMPIYSPDREKEVLNNVERLSEGPLEPVTMRRLFERIVDEARRIERETSEMKKQRGEKS